ncbi:proton channel OTOP2-like isoform X2 [Periophthalmus magnuspinnatus]|uniref:proton channel OTOP2-like isoform X2 n=1 Tax=Periophthalmus magnuspinnatus TaxID=409849 RepID=UPI00145B8B1C|nr:proton channel OTOP2-like isoform X2 [Periophthalmus magnuspinnatus]
MQRVAQKIFEKTCTNLLTRKMTSNNRIVEAHSSNIESASHHTYVHDDSAVSMESTVERTKNTSGKLISGIICINILFLGCAIVCGSAFNYITITPVHRQLYLIILLLLTMSWMIFYMVHTSQKNQHMLSKDIHAAPVWLRAGLVMFGILSLLMDVLKISNYVGYIDCDSGTAIKITFPVVQALFLFVQTYFFLTHAKDCVLSNKNITWCGLTITLSTNLVVWMEAVTEESLHQTEFPEFYENCSDRIYKVSYGDKTCKCNQSTCTIFKGAYHYLYPFNIEYSLFASAMAYVMWKNVGRLVRGQSHHHNFKFHAKEVCLGPIAGVILVLAGLVTFVFYEVGTQMKENKNDTGLHIHFITNIVIVCLMCLSTAVGLIVYILDHRDHVSEKNPTRSLDVGLLVGSSMGQFLISYFTIVAVVSTGVTDCINVLNLAWAVMLVIQIGLQNYFIIEGLHREPFHMLQQSMVSNSSAAYQQHTEPSVVVENSHPSYQFSSAVHKLNWKRRVLKEVCLFLLLANIILWIMPAFGARPQFDQTIEIIFYKFTMWATIVNIGLPFGIFYRLHSVASLFEVYLTS